MAKKAIFQQLIADAIERSFDHVVDREIVIPVDVPKVISLVGPRRAGKTFVLYGLIRMLRATIPPECLVYINFEDDRLFPLQLSDLDGLITGYYEMYPEYRDRTVYFFLDEVQEVPHWEKFVRRITDQEDCRVYLTGSSSKLLSQELATTLRGRTISFEIFPLSFSEFLSFQNIDVNLYSSRGKTTLVNALQQYLQQGGFPELLFSPVSLHQKIIQEYLDLMIYRDLTERFSLKNPPLIKYLLKHLLLNVANPLSIHKVYNDLRSQGFRVAKNTVYEYLGYLEDAFILFRVERWSRSVRQQAVNPIKIYAVDIAFRRAMSAHEDTGRLFENVVFLHLRRSGLVPNYFLDQQEVDFYGNDQPLINACYTLDNPATRKREEEGLLSAMHTLNHTESWLITWDEEQTIQRDGKTIHVLPLWKWLLDGANG